MSYLLLILQILPALLKLMNLAEEMSEPGTGENKKKFVTEAIKVIISTIIQVSTGSQKEVWEKISGPVSDLIDLLASILFPKAQ